MPETKEVLGQRATLFRDGPNPIYLLPDGRFAYQWAGRWIAKTSLKAVEKVLGRERPSIKLFQAEGSVSYHSWGPVHVRDIAEWGDNKLTTKDGKRVWKGYGNWYLFNAEVVAKLEEYYKRRAKIEDELNKEYEKIIRKLRSVNSFEFKELIAKEVKRAEQAKLKDAGEKSAQAGQSDEASS